VTLEVECIDRMYLNLYQPKLQHELGVVGFFKGHRGYPFVSSALMDPISRSFVAAIHQFVEHEGVPLVRFAPGQRKDDVAHEHLARFAGTEGVLFVGRAQEKTLAYRTEKRRNPVTGASYPWLVRRSAMVNHFYVYAVDADFGPFFLKFSTYFPYNAKLCINGNEWAKRQAAKAGLAFEPLDNGFLSCAEPARLQALCDTLGATQIDALARKWLARLPHPFTAADQAAGYRYDVSVLQAEFSLTQTLDRPVTGRVFFEEVIRDNLDLGRPDRVGLVFDRRVTRRTPGRFRTRVITDGVVPPCTWTTSTPRSSSTTSWDGRCVPRPPSTTPATSASANGCTTCLPSGRSASRPTGVCWTSNEQATTPSVGPTPSPRSPPP
jgi:hypothetical protein